VAGDANQRKVFDFLLAHLESQDPFSKDDIRLATGWEQKTVDTYWSKQFRPFIQELEPGKYRVTEAFRPYSLWRTFRQHVSQVRAGSSGYKRWPVSNVVIFEFFMPLKHEEHLRTTLDALFYRNTVFARIKHLKAQDLNEHFEYKPSDSEDTYKERLCKWISDRFLGYSITHVSGRFRLEPLKTREEAGKLPPGHKYLADETTAVVRFIFPCSDQQEAKDIKWFFTKLFTESILEAVGEDEVWIVESGMFNGMERWVNEREEDD